MSPAPIEDKLGAHEAIEACVVAGANLGQPLGIAMLNADAMARAADSGAKAELEKSLAEHIQAINAKLDPHERLMCVVVVREPWTVENGVITPTFKIKRNRIEELYAANFEKWEASGKKVIWDGA